MEKIKIEKGIPMPTKKEYPWDEMEIGDSFFVKANDNDIVKTHSSIQSLGIRWFRVHKPDGKVATRKVEGGVRIWRIK
jgi:hypothetical protein